MRMSLSVRIERGYVAILRYGDRNGRGQKVPTPE